jgi:hypothetical protein
MRYRRNILIAAITACVAAGAAIAPAAIANPLLSGYGGPGQGDQAILGAALVNGPKGGGGSSSGTPTSLAAPSAVTTLTKVGVGRRSRSRTKGATGNRRPGDASKNGSGAYTAPTVAGAAPPATASSGGVLGLSITDLLYVSLALGGLAAVAALTRGLAGASNRDGEALKG